MIKVNLDMLEKMDKSWRITGKFALFSGVGTKSSAVYFELEPGFQLGTHTDSAEEIVLTRLQ
jgi:hypothetical protein